MKISITLPDELAERVSRRADRDEFVLRAVTAAFQREAPELSVPQVRHSKWARLVEKIEGAPTSLGDYREALKKDREDFRASFSFRSDEP